MMRSSGADASHPQPSSDNHSSELQPDHITNQDEIWPQIYGASQASSYQGNGQPLMISATQSPSSYFAPQTWADYDYEYGDGDLDMSDSDGGVHIADIAPVLEPISPTETGVVSSAAPNLPPYHFPPEQNETIDPMQSEDTPTPSSSATPTFDTPNHEEQADTYASPVTPIILESPPPPVHTFNHTVIAMQLQQQLQNTTGEGWEGGDPISQSNPNPNILGPENHNLVDFLKSWAWQGRYMQSGRGAQVPWISKINEQVSTKIGQIRYSDLQGDNCDMQGIDWESLGVTRRGARDRRLSTYKNYTNKLGSDIWHVSTTLGSRVIHLWELFGIETDSWG
jgi:hypothetical protein